VNPESSHNPASSIEATLESDVATESSQISEETPDTRAEQTSASTGRSVASATLGVGAMHFLRFVIGFLAQPLIASNTGLRWQAEAYAVSTDIIQRLWLIWEKVINPAFLPTFIGAMKAEGEERAWRFASTATLLTALSLLVVAPLAWLFMPQIVDLYTPRTAEQHSAQEIELTIRIGRLLLLALFFLGMSSLTYTILNGYKRFVVAALGDTLWKLGAFSAALFVVAFHIEPENALPIIAWGYIAGAFFKLAPHVWAIGRKWKMLRLRIDWSDPLTRTMMMLALPLFFGIMVSEVRGIYLQRLAGDPSIQVEAGRAALKWSRIIGDNLIQIFPYALSIGIFPYLADLAREKDRQPLTDTLMGALRVCVFFFVPVMAILIALRFPLLRAVWESGRLTENDTIVMSGPFVGFTVGLIAFSCEMMLNQTFYAMTRAWTPTIIGICTSAIWVLIATFGVKAGYGLAAIALSESISKSIKCLVMWIMLRPHLGNVKPRENFVFALKVLAGALLAAAVAHFVIGFAEPEDGAARFKVKMLLAVTIAGIAGMTAFTIWCSATGISEARQVLGVGSKLKRKFRK
jgi:putative peptidoglycan lipid II flippase